MSSIQTFLCSHRRSDWNTGAAGNCPQIRSSGPAENRFHISGRRSVGCRKRFANSIGMPGLRQSHAEDLLVEKGLHPSFISRSCFYQTLPPQNNLMPNGEANVTGNTFEILHADRHSAGHYRCSADNRVGAADTREIFVNVLCKEMNHSLSERSSLKAFSSPHSFPRN